MKTDLKGAGSRRFRPFMVACILLGCACAAFAQEPPQAPKKEAIRNPPPRPERVEVPLRISPDEAVKRAIKNNLDMETARVDLDTRKRQSDLVWNQFLPNLDIQGKISRDNWAAKSQELGITLPQWHVGGGFAVTLPFNFALFEGIKAINLGYEAGLAGFETARARMEREVRKMYNQILLVEANAALLQENYANTRRRAGIAEENFKAGLAPRLTWLQAQVAVENMKPTINETENNLKNLLANFALILGLPYDTELELDPITTGEFLISPDVEELISKAAAGKPDILALQKAIQASQSARKAQAIQLYTPILTFAWNVAPSFNLALDPWQESWFKGENWTKAGAFSFTLSMNLNGLFPFTKEGQGLKDTDNRLMNEKINLAKTIRETEIEIYTKVNSLEKTRTTAEAQRLTVEMAEQAYRLTEEAYRAGLQDLLEVQNAELSLNQARLQLLVQQFNYLNDLIDLEYAIGVPFGTLSSRSVQ
jgi:outer membrane protein TolC